ncbi:MAG: AraC family transcriptional regulator [Actinomycetota bacterium]|nr:AraC family transcriptional regulator [Actinomycetota bacterium]
MDEIAGFLDGPRARRAFLLRATLDPPWSLRIQDEAPLTVLAIVRGGAWVVHEGAAPVRLDAGAVAVVRGPQAYVVADDPATSPQIVVDPGGDCRNLDGASMAEVMGLGVRTWGNAVDGADVMLVGTYLTDGEVGGRFVGALPQRIVVPAAAMDTPLVALLATEIVKETPGQQVVLDRLLDLLLVAAVRAWFAAPGATPPPWYRATGDPLVAGAMRLLHDDPARPWSVASLAAAVGASRAALARRFHDVVGEPPMTFLTNWRMALAADLLRQPAATVGGVAAQVGYTSPFTFSTAFKRVHGVSPSAHRAAAAA